MEQRKKQDSCRILDQKWDCPSEKHDSKYENVLLGDGYDWLVANEPFRAESVYIK